MSNQLTRDETRLMVELLNKEIYDPCIQLDLDKEACVGHSQHGLAEEKLE